MGIEDKEGKIAQPRQATGFSMYVKEHFARVKAALEGGGEGKGNHSGGVATTSGIMKELAVQYKAAKSSNATGSNGTTAGDAAAARQGSLQRKFSAAAIDLTDSIDSDVEEGLEELQAQLGEMGI